MEPGDLRPAFEGDLKLIEEALLNEFSTDIIRKTLNMNVGNTYLNKVPHIDDMKEVIVGGEKVGRVYFDPKYLMWRWRLAGYSILLAINYGLVKVFRRDKVRPLEVLGDCSRDGDQAVVVSNSGEPIALALCRRGKYRVQSLIKTSIKYPNLKSSTSLNDVYRANEGYLRELVSKSVKHIYIMSSKVRLPVILSYSGGKDSLLSLHLCLIAGIEPKLLFNNTGIELPPVIRNVEYVTNRYGLELIEASANGKFWDAVKVFGPPAKDYRWCCKVVKLAPIAKVYKRFFSDGLLAIIGQRALESVDRSWVGSVWRNKWLPYALNITPIREWDQLCEWLYIISEGLPVNELYFQGFDRLGCFLCPAAYMAEYHIVSKKFPHIWSRWVRELEFWRRKLNKDINWVRYHLWRWLDPLGQGRRRVEIWLGMKKVSDWIRELSLRSPTKIELKLDREGRHAEIFFKEGKVINGLIENYFLIGNLSSLKNELSVINAGDSRIIIDSRSLRIIIDGENFMELLSLVLKVGIRYAFCVNCGLCESICPTEAIKVINQKPVISKSKCLRCLSCIDLCPISNLLVNKVILPALLRSKEVPRTTSKPFILELVRAQRRLLIEREAKDRGFVVSNLDNFFESLRDIS